MTFEPSTRIHTTIHRSLSRALIRVLQPFAPQGLSWIAGSEQDTCVRNAVSHCAQPRRKKPGTQATDAHNDTQGAEGALELTVARGTGVHPNTPRTFHAYSHSAHARTRNSCRPVVQRELAFSGVHHGGSNWSSPPSADGARRQSAPTEHAEERVGTALHPNAGSASVRSFKRCSLQDSLRGHSRGGGSNTRGSKSPGAMAEVPAIILDVLASKFNAVSVSLRGARARACTCACTRARCLRGCAHAARRTAGRWLHRQLP